MSLHSHRVAGLRQKQSIKSYSNAFSPEIASYIWARFTQLTKLSEEEVEKLFNNYEAKLSAQMVHSLGRSIINMYSMGACAAIGISNQDVLSEDLENDPFLNSALQRATCELYYRFGLFLAPLSIGIIMSRHYLYERNNNGGTSGDNEGPATTDHRVGSKDQ